mgnify:CR=1 FL=1
MVEMPILRLGYMYAIIYYEDLKIEGCSMRVRLSVFFSRFQEMRITKMNQL